MTTADSPGGRLHVGSLIHDELRRQERQVAWLARHLNCDRTNVYKIFQKPDIDTALLRRVSVALNHDFFADLSSSCGFCGNGAFRE